MSVRIRCTFFFSSRSRHTRSYGDWSSDVCSSDLAGLFERTKTTRTAMSSQERGDLLRDLLPGRAVAERVRPLQIGRASCRERVWISVAGGEGQKRDTVIIATLKLVNDIVYC